jgi:predicted GNAT family acetyltransferase
MQAGRLALFFVRAPHRPVRLTTFDDPAAFELAARDFFAAREAQYNLLAGLTGTLIERPDAYGSATPYLAIVHDEAGHIALVALRTPPHRLIVSEASGPAALEVLVAGVLKRWGSLSGVLGPTATAHAFAERWQRATGEGAVKVRAERIYELTAVIPPRRPVPGRLVDASQTDRPLLLDWMESFTGEAHGVRDRRAAERMVDQRLASRHAGLHLWIDGEPMCMAGASGPTATGIRIGVVYTPPERRGRGYASACVAALSQLLLDAGRQRCFLFTDLANPTSNSIYQAIGYRPVGDMAEIDLAAPARGADGAGATLVQGGGQAAAGGLGTPDWRRHLPGQRARAGAQSLLPGEVSAIIGPVAADRAGEDREIVRPA